ncbi:MAG: hypothetical protein IPQ09_25380 [Myxococcales bacterium]|nr:hypothetical protein [Myxococcales bacterium]
MQFEITHEFDIPLDALELAFLSPDLGAKLSARLPHIEALTQLTHKVDVDRLERVWSFRANVKIPRSLRSTSPRRCARGKRPPYDIRRHAASWRLKANVKPEWQKYFASSGSYLLEPLETGRTRRTVRGTLDLNVSLARGVAEKPVFS